MTDASASSYVHANAAFDDELGRLHLLNGLAQARCGARYWDPDRTGTTAWSGDPEGGRAGS